MARRVRAELTPIATSGDRFAEASLSRIGGKGLFTNCRNRPTVISNRSSRKSLTVAG